MSRETEKDVLARFDGRGVMLKVKQALDIDKMAFSFVTYGQNNKSTGSINCYLDAVEFALLMERIRNESLQKAIFAEKQRQLQSGDKYPKDIYTSPMGGARSGDGAISRMFVIAPAMKNDVMFRAIAFSATVSPTGAFIPKKGEKPIQQIIVSTSFHELAKMAYKWQWLEKDYMSHKYCMDNMKDTYRKDHDSESATEVFG